MNGYWHPDYARSFAEFGRPRELTQCGGWILERPILGFPDHDAMGCYPLFVCSDWSKLEADLKNIGTELVSLVIVPDPFGEYDETSLRRCFPDLVIPFKEHYVVDLAKNATTHVSRHHRYYARRALRNLRVELCTQPLRYLEDWCQLYDNLTQKHRLQGIKAFSRATFARQLSIPGLLMFRAVAEDRTVGAYLWFMHGDVAYGHLGAFSPLGYRLGAPYALIWTIIEYYSGKVRWVELEGNAGTRQDNEDGLSFFKRGWATGTRVAYLCGRIFQRGRYGEITRMKGLAEDGYFPAYRKGEFG